MNSDTAVRRHTTDVSEKKYQMEKGHYMTVRVMALAKHKRLVLSGFCTQTPQVYGLVFTPKWRVVLRLNLSYEKLYVQHTYSDQEECNIPHNKAEESSTVNSFHSVIL